MSYSTGVSPKTLEILLHVVNNMPDCVHQNFPQWQVLQLIASC